MNTCEHGWGVAPCVPCLQAELAAERARADRAERDCNALSLDVQALTAERDALRERVDRAERGWLPGEPPKPYRSEWFIAETTYGDRVVLKAVPEEYAHDYRTADDTYLLAKSIKRWMQFPDSEYVCAAEAETAALRERVTRLVGALEAITRRVPIMASTGDYRTGQLHALEACAAVARTALEGK